MIHLVEAERTDSYKCSDSHSGAVMSKKNAATLKKEKRKKEMKKINKSLELKSPRVGDQLGQHSQTIY